MKATELIGNWQIQKGRLKQLFTNLSDKDLLYIDGKKDEMLGRLQEKLGKTKEELNEIISNL